ncbi:hypothetical protein ACQ4PT_002345 [Festuca glaucescens]
MAGSGEADDPITDEERERRYARFFGEEVAHQRRILQAPWAEQLFGPCLKDFGLGILQQEIDEANGRKGKEPLRETGKIEEEVVGGARVEGFDLDVIDLHREDPPPEQEPEKMQVEQNQVKPQPPPSSQAQVQSSWSSYEPWVTFPREEDNPATWIRDEFDGEWRPRSAGCSPPYYRDPDPEAPQYFDDMAGYYLEAARRLPVAQMSKLAGFLTSGALLLGSHDPVTNIMLNAIYLMEKSRTSYGVLPRGADPVRHAADRASYVGATRRSRAALVNFMAFYFRHLTQAHAKRYLRAARHDLALAVGLVQWHRSGGFGLPLSPECGRTKAAFRYAAKAAMLFHAVHLADVLEQLVLSRFPRHLLDPVLDDLRRGEQLSVGSVNGILNLLRKPWSLPPPLPAPTPGTFRDADGNVTIIANIGQGLFSTTTITRDRAATFSNNKNGDLVTTTTISRHPSRPDNDNDLAPASDYLSSGSDTESRLRSFLSTTTALQLKPDTNSLKMCLLDTIHGLYIQALAMLPSDHQPRLLRAMLAGGHSYGVMEDPVSNIVVNSIWYNARFPHPENADDDDDDTLIKATRSMTRAESSSLHGLIAILRANRGLTEQEAVACLCSNRRNLPDVMMNNHSLAAAAEAAKHPQPAALLAFVTSLTQDREKLDRLRSLLMTKRVLSGAEFTELNMMISGNDIAASPVPRMPTPDPSPSPFQAFGSPFQLGIFKTVPRAPVQRMSANPFQPAAVFLAAQTMTTLGPFHPGTVSAAPVKRMTHDRWQQSYVSTKVEELLLDYGRNNPLRPQYKLGVICGMASEQPGSGACSACHKEITCYHVNFLASTPADDATTSPPECKLFFAKFWDEVDEHFEGSKKPPVCCPVQDVHAFPSRCFICEWGLVRIVHPPCGNYSIGHDWYSTDAFCAAAERHADLSQQD